jgi:hypothetical protein
VIREVPVNIKFKYAPAATLGVVSTNTVMVLVDSGAIDPVSLNPLPSVSVSGVRPSAARSAIVQPAGGAG